MTTFTHIKFDDNCDIIENRLWNVLEINRNGIMKCAIMKCVIMKPRKVIYRNHIKFNENCDIIENQLWKVLEINRNGIMKCAIIKSSKVIYRNHIKFFVENYFYNILNKEFDKIIR